MDWFAVSGVFVVAVAWLFIPGGLVAFALRLRGIALLSFAPVCSTAILAVSAVLFGFTGVVWSPWSASAAVLVVALLALVVRRLVRPPVAPQTPLRGPRWFMPASIAIGACLVALRLVLYVGSPDNPSQTNDGVFHLNVLRYIIDSGSASSLDVSGMLGISSFYPAAWHALASLVAMSTGAEIVVAANVTSIVIGALVWTIGITWLTLIATRHDRVAAGVAALLAAALPSFPLLMMQWGVLYPSLLAIALLPAALAVLIDEPESRRSLAVPLRAVAMRVGLLVVALSAIALAQPSLLLIWGVLACSFGFWKILGSWRTSTFPAQLAMVTAAVFSIAALSATWVVLGWLTTSIWPPYQGRLEALLAIASNGLVGFPAVWGVSVLMFVGIAVAVRRPHLRWLMTGWIVLATLYLVVVSIGNPFARLVVAPFYADPYRLAAIMPIVVLPLAGIGLSWTVLAVQKRLIRSGDPRQPSASPRLHLALTVAMAIIGIGSVVVVPIVHWHDVWTDVTDRVTWYEMTETSYLTLDERNLLGRLPELVPDELIVGNPSTGMAYGYALADQPVYPLTWQPPQTAAYAVLASSLNRVASDPLVCPAVEAIGARYVLDFGPGEADYGRYLLPGFTDIAGRAGFELVDRQGDALLWRITACD